jgi:ankyrin repeat protein/uncharacterized caspase-like protein
MKIKYEFLLLLTFLLLLIGCSITVHRPVQYGDLDHIKAIIRKDSTKINEKNDDGNTLLHIAAHEDDIDIARYLVSQGADVNIKDNLDQTPLQIAISEANVELAKYLISNGADVDAKNHFQQITSLHTAVDKGNLEIAKLLVLHGANINAKNFLHESPLYIAVKRSRLEVAKYLVSQGADLNTRDKRGKYLLHEAASLGDLEQVKFLISKDVDVNAKDKNDSCPLHDAVEHGNLEVTKYLVSHGADVNAKGAWEGAWGGYFPKTLGWTPLHIAAHQGHLEVVKFLISQGANVYAKNNEDETAMALAQRQEHKEIVTLLSSKEELTKLSKAIKTAEKTTSKKTPPKEITQSKPFAYQDIDFGHYYALVIGNNNYQSLPKLISAKNDAQEVAKILTNLYGFSVELLIDVSRSEILLALRNLRNNLVYKDNLLIYYAGHGWLDKEADEGYWLPINAEKNNMINWISNSSITATLRAIRAKHVLIVADSCYSGKLARGIRTVNKRPGYISRLSQKRARCVISSGGIEPVTDSGGKGLHSVFASAFLDALKENKEIIDGVQLFTKLRRPVMLNSDQTPEFADIRKAGHEGGEFLFVRKK